jgi:hypothetical protein
MLPSTLHPGVHSAFNINEYLKQKNNGSGEQSVASDRVDNLNAICEPSKQCGILSISQPYRPPQPVTAITLLFTLWPKRPMLLCELCHEKVKNGVS